MIKNGIYQINNKNIVCILCDDEFACVCPISFNRDDNGYNIKISKSEIYSQRVEVITLKQIGMISHNEAITLLGVPMRLRKKN